MPEFLGMRVSETFLPALKAGVRTKIELLTEHPAPTDGVVVNQDPSSGTKMRRNARVTLIVYHPPEAESGFSPRSG